MRKQRKKPVRRTLAAGQSVSYHGVIIKMVEVSKRQGNRALVELRRERPLLQSPPECNSETFDDVGAIPLHDIAEVCALRDAVKAHYPRAYCDANEHRACVFDLQQLGSAGFRMACESSVVEAWRAAARLIPAENVNAEH